MDKESEEQIKNVILRLENILCLLISHKEDIIKDCDVIYIMENGRIVEEGNYYMLQSTGKIYNKLFN